MDSGSSGPNKMMMMMMMRIDDDAAAAATTTHRQDSEGQHGGHVPERPASRADK